MSTYADLIERLSNAAWDRSVADSLTRWQREREQAADAISRLEREKASLIEALQFYADESGWNQPPVKTIAHELLGTAYENQASKIRVKRRSKGTPDRRRRGTPFSDNMMLVC